jgi:putative ABC transport system permease protein
VIPASLLLGPLLQNRGRLLVCVAAIALGVALGYAVQIINQSAIGEFSQALRTLSGEADLTVRGPRAGFDDALYPRLARLPQVAVASAAVEVDAKVLGHDDPLKIVGVDVFRAAQIQPALLAETGELLDTLRADTLFLSPAAREWLGVAIGDTVRIQVGLGEVELRVAGWLHAEGTRQRLAIMDIAGAQWLLDRLGRITRVDLKLRPGVSTADALSRIQALLPAGVTVERPETSVRATASLTRAYRVNLNVLALVALFTGGLLVFSTQALSVVRRRSQLALLRVVGVTRRGLAALLVAEGTIVGAIGAAVGVAAGFGLATVVLRTVGADLGAGHFRGVVTKPTLELHWLAVFFLLGVGVAVLGALLPALEAGRAAPARALKAGDDQRVFERFMPAWPGLVVAIAGGAMSILPPVGGLPLFGYLAIALLLVGSILLMPRVMRYVLASLPAARSPALALAQRQLANAPGPATAGLAAVVAAVSLTVAMAIMVASFRQSLEDWLDHMLPADLYLRAGGAGDTAYLSEQDQQRIAGLPGVRRAEFLRSQQIVLGPSRPRVTLLARSLDGPQPQNRLPVLGAYRLPGEGEPPAAWISELMVDVYGFSVGQVIALPVAGRSERFTVAGVWRDYARQTGAIAIDRALYIRLTGDTSATDAGLFLAAGESAPELEARLRVALPGGERLEISQPSEIRDLSLRIFDRSFAVTYALEAAAIVIGLFGLSSSLASQVLARRREFGMLRHIGMTRLQIAAMLGAEGALTSAVGLAVGCALGWLIGLILIHVVNRQSFHWSMELHVPWSGLLLFAMAMVVLAVLAAMTSGRQAMGRDVVRAVREDW